MPRYRAIVAYDGTDFSGWQVQPSKRTVQGELEKAVNRMAKNPEQPIRVQGSGRTDAGVHALGQVAHFDLPFDIPESGVRKGLATMLPFDIEIKKVEKVDADFHAQYSAHTKRISIVYQIVLFGTHLNAIILDIGRVGLILVKLKWR